MSEAKRHAPAACCPGEGFFGALDVNTTRSSDGLWEGIEEEGFRRFERKGTFVEPLLGGWKEVSED